VLHLAAKRNAPCEPVPTRLARNTIIESTFEVGRRFRCTMRVDCGQLDPGAVIRPEPGEWHPHMPERLDEEELEDWRAGRNAVYQLAALTVEARRPTNEPIPSYLLCRRFVPIKIQRDQLYVGP
jgi:hypothetical protein